MVLARLRSLVRSWQEVRDLTRTSPERLAALVQREEQKAARSKERLEAVQRSMAAPLEKAEEYSAEIKQRKQEEAAAIQQKLAKQLEAVNIDAFELQQKAVHAMADEMEAVLTRGGSTAAKEVQKRSSAAEIDAIKKAHPERAAALGLNEPDKPRTS